MTVRAQEKDHVYLQTYVVAILDIHQLPIVARLL